MAHADHVHTHAPVSQGYIVLADISGFDEYLTGVELDHAQGVLQELYELIRDYLIPPMTLASLEGGAILAYAHDEDMPRSDTLLELTEGTYAAFRDRVRTIRRNTTCDCKACLNIPNLDLKFLIHHGEFIARDIDGASDLMGLDVSLVRDRLLKDQAVGEEGPRRAYALYTENCLTHMGVNAESMTSNMASYPHYGEVKTAHVDLKSQYQKLNDTRHQAIEDSKSDLTLTHEYDVSPPVLWDWLNDPHKRTRWQNLREWTLDFRPDGRLGVGARNHCAHGLGIIEETIVDWRPYESFTSTMRQSNLLNVMETFQLEPLENDRVRLTMRVRVADYALRVPVVIMYKLLTSFFRVDLQRLERIMAEDEAAM